MIKKNCYCIILVLLCIGCSKVNKLKGYWYTTNNEGPVLLNFTENILIDCFYPRDTMYYQYSKDKIILYGHGKPDTLKYLVKNSTLDIYNFKTDSLLGVFKRPSKENFINDFISDNLFDMNLPSGNGTKDRYGNGGSHIFNELIYIYKKEDKIHISFRGLKTEVNDSLHNFINQKIIDDRTKASNESTFTLLEEYDTSTETYGPISIIADKEVKLKDIEFIKKQLKLANFNSIIMMLSNTEKYDYSNYLHQKLEPLLKTDTIKYGLTLGKNDFPEPLANFDKDNSILLNLKESNIEISGKNYSLEEIQSLITQKYESLDYLKTFYSFDDKTNYQHYISVLDIAYNSTLNQRKNYLLKKYNIDYYSKDFKHRELIKESINKFPFFFASDQMIKK